MTSGRVPLLTLLTWSLSLAECASASRSLAFISSSPSKNLQNVEPRYQTTLNDAFLVNDNNDQIDNAPPQAPPPMFNGQRVLPGTIVLAGLKASGGLQVPAVYSVLESKEWKNALHVGVTQDLFATLQAWSAQQGNPRHIRALSFTLADPIAMQQVADQWKEQAQSEGATADLNQWVDPSSFLYDDDDDDDDDDWDEDDFEMTANAMAQMSSSYEASSISVEATPDASEEAEQEDTIVSPFATTTAAAVTSGASAVQFTVETVDKVLDEVRPYLVADGGNVAVAGVDPDTLNVQLELQGACGSCPSSTVTMQMGIERVLREQFGPGVTCEQVNPNEIGDGNSEDALQLAVQEELNRMSQAIIAMGGVVRLLNVNVDTGVVQLQFRGANKLQQGLELALLDLPQVNAVQFVSTAEGEE